jgi:hypothetical protein
MDKIEREIRDLKERVAALEAGGSVAIQPRKSPGPPLRRGRP